MKVRVSMPGAYMVMEMDEGQAFDVACYDCGNPVAVEWNPKKKQYETMRGRAE